MAFSQYDFCNLGLTEAQLLSMRDAVLANMTTTLVNGKVITSVNAPGLTTTFQVYATPTEVLRAITFALQLINPSLYGPAPMSQTIGFVR